MPATAQSQPLTDRSWLLAIDTATPQAGIAVTNGEEFAATTWPGGRRQTTSVASAITELLDRAEVSLVDLGAIAVTTGPGSFTGLRVGLSLAKGMALEPERDMVGVPTLEVVAAPLLELGLLAIAVIPAGRGRVVWAESSGGMLGEPVNSEFSLFLDAVSARDNAVVVGELDRSQRSSLLDGGIVLAPVPLGLDRAGTLAAIGYGRWRNGATTDADSLQPIYLHGRPNPR